MTEIAEAVAALGPGPLDEDSGLSKAYYRLNMSWKLPLSGEYRLT